MYYVLTVHITENIKHLSEEESSYIFTHGSAALTEVDEGARLNAFHEEVRQVILLHDIFTLDVTIASMAIQTDNIRMLQILCHLDLSFD